MAGGAAEHCSRGRPTGKGHAPSVARLPNRRQTCAETIRIRASSPVSCRSGQCSGAARRCP
eukprot:scaffold29208_cov118-Phaeocystis_antarctica.AAC.2